MFQHIKKEKQPNKRTKLTLVWKTKAKKRILLKTRIQNKHNKQMQII